MPHYRCKQVHALFRRLFESAIILILNRSIPGELAFIFLCGISGQAAAANIDSLPAKQAPTAAKPAFVEKHATLSAPFVERTEGADFKIQ